MNNLFNNFQVQVKTGHTLSDTLQNILHVFAYNECGLLKLLQVVAEQNIRASAFGAHDLFFDGVVPKSEY